MPRVMLTCMMLIVANSCHTTTNQHKRHAVPAKKKTPLHLLKVYALFRSRQTKFSSTLQGFVMMCLKYAGTYALRVSCSMLCIVRACIHVSNQTAKRRRRRRRRRKKLLMMISYRYMLNVEPLNLHIRLSAMLRMALRSGLSLHVSLLNFSSVIPAPFHTHMHLQVAKIWE